MKTMLKIMLIILTAVAIAAALLMRGLLSLLGYGVRIIGGMASRIN